MYEHGAAVAVRSAWRRMVGARFIGLGRGRQFIALSERGLQENFRLRAKGHVKRSCSYTLNKLENKSLLYQ